MWSGVMLTANQNGCAGKYVHSVCGIVPKKIQRQQQQPKQNKRQWKIDTTQKLTCCKCIVHRLVPAFSALPVFMCDKYVDGHKC